MVRKGVKDLGESEGGSRSERCGYGSGDGAVGTADWYRCWMNHEWKVGGCR